MTLKHEAEKPRVVMNLRTTEDVRIALKEEAKRQDRSVNWVMDRAVKRGLGLKEAA